MQRRGFIASAAAVLASCGRSGKSGAGAVEMPPPTEAPFSVTHTPHLRIEQRGPYTIVRVSARIRSWSQQGGGGAQSSAVLVLAPRGEPAPLLSGEFANAVLIRTPVERIAVTSGTEEAFLVELDLEDRLVAVGGIKSYNDAIRARALSGELGQIGYSWHSPPNLDVALATRPDVIITRLANLDHAPVLDRARRLGLAVAPIFVDAEASYLARAEWIKFFGLLAGKTSEAKEKFNAVEARTSELKAMVAQAPKQSVLWAYLYAGDRWSAIVRNAEAQFVEDAGGLNVLGEAHDPTLDGFREVSTEELLRRGRDAECWIAGDIHARPLPRARYLQEFRAWRNDNLWSNDGRSKPEVDAFDWYETAWVRPDIVLADFVKMLHPQRIVHDLQFLRRMRRVDVQ